ncbi:hypothetical protein M2T82_00945 [Elizabethkingia ursingii]|uniref:hypothetical protein n=1 Tax=Elizabethkingia ursingii TaxID=1756150 RepID=UPI002012A26C|nr:hypothetical protein [Elizabethkingia ursingii]MCL1666620.1 hypothetical protein [Elizabethkingia ursingii]
MKQKIIKNFEKQVELEIYKYYWILLIDRKKDRYIGEVQYFENEELNINIHPSYMIEQWQIEKYVVPLIEEEKLKRERLLKSFLGSYSQKDNQ